MSEHPLKGVIVPLVTPYYDNGSQNLPALLALAERLAEAGVNGLMTGGTTGEGPLLSLDERRAQTELLTAHFAGRVPITVMAGAVTTRESIDLACHAARYGAAAVSVICPYYYGLSDEAIIEHFCAVAESVPPGFPVYLYNFPQRTANVITPAVSQAVAQRCPNVIGEKDSSGDLGKMVAKLRVRGGQFDLLCGSDDLILPALTLGASGAVAGNANMFPDLFTGLYRAYQASDMPAALAFQRKIHALTSAMQSNLALFKDVMNEQGLEMGGVRAPLQAASAESVRAALLALREAGIL